jgi:glycerophosphoryl diester phosphodiesterase
MNWKQFRATYAPNRPLVVAHRGVPGQRPENTLASFRLALEQGADALETDLHFTRDRVIVLHHDDTLERTTNGVGPLGNKTLAELKQLRTRGPDGTLSDERIPTLAELIYETGAQVPLLLELKDPLFAIPENARTLATTLDTAGVTSIAAVISLDFELVTAVKAVAPAIAAGYITLRNPFPRRKAQILGPYWPILKWNPIYVWWAHLQGSIVAPLDPQPEARIAFYLERNVDALLADDPASVRRAIDNAMKPRPSRNTT